MLLVTALGEGGGSGPTMRPATPADLGAVEALLRSVDLPVAGVAEAISGFVVAESEGVVLGVAGLEVHGGDGVLRSVAVHPSLQGQGMGARLSRWVVAEAKRRGLGRLYLLTTTAEGYFPRLGFHRIARDEASAEVRGSIEFREACPASAVAMALDLTG